MTAKQTFSFFKKKPHCALLFCYAIIIFNKELTMYTTETVQYTYINPLNAELNPIRHLLALAGARHFVDVSKIRVKKLSL
jgi:hypothetical protein